MQAQNENKSMTDAQILRHWLDYSVPRGEYNKVKRRIVEVCLVPVHTLNNWIYGACRIPESGKRDINRVAIEISGEEIFTVAQPGGDSVGV